ncbi:hypothetical protein Tdes44962_MAKER10209 [Teratosphaeria destructans]|uniref:Uncharacterized protein n=1 Tax=Teratosphaeria destructans TaxID=418781 RepID=A0A9W7W050_9PEZI|nr:hypothetical protein Tdes44962_MAKER10209 [Teratosphaeria destructans]
MARPVLVRAYTGNTGISTSAPRAPPLAAELHPLPPISSYAFADILRAANCPDFQHAIDGIADICAKNRLSLADEYGSHLPPLGEITATSSAAAGARPHLSRPGPRRALTAVPEVSSSGSESSVKSKRRRRSIFSFRKQTVHESNIIRQITIGRGRTIAVNGTTAISRSDEHEQGRIISGGNGNRDAPAGDMEACPLGQGRRAWSDATASLHRILGNAFSSAG